MAPVDDRHPFHAEQDRDDRNGPLDGDHPRPRLEGLERAAHRELALWVEEDAVAAIQPPAQQLQAAAHGALAGDREGVRHDRGKDPAEPVLVDRLGPGRDGQLPAEPQREVAQDDRVVQVQAMVRRDEDRPVYGAEVLHAGRPDAVEDVRERRHEEHLEGEANRAHGRIERPAIRALLPLRRAGRLDEGCQLRDRGIRVQDGLVEVDPQLLFDDPEELHSAEGIEVEVAGEARLGRHPGDGHAGDRRHEGGERVGSRGVGRSDERGRRRDACRRRVLQDGEPREDLVLADLHGRGARQIRVGPDRHVADPLVRGEALVGCPDDRVRIRRIGQEHHGVDLQVRAGRPADNRGVRQAGILPQDRLDVLRVDLLPVGERQHVLLAAAEGQEAVGRQLAEVAGVVPALGVDRRRRRDGVLPVASEPVRAASKDLAVRRDPDLDVRDRLADRLHPVAPGPGEADDRSHLGCAIALEHVDAHLGPALRDVELDRRRTDADRVEAPAERRDHGPEEEAAKRPREGTGEPVESLEGNPAPGLVDAPLDGVAEEAKSLRDEEDHRDTEVAERPQEDGRLPAHRVDDARPDAQRADEADHLLVQV